MKYVIDIDSFAECLDCLDCIKVNGEYYIALPVIKEFLDRFPKDKVASEYVEYNTKPAND